MHCLAKETSLPGKGVLLRQAFEKEAIEKEEEEEPVREKAEEEDAWHKESGEETEKEAGKDLQNQRL